jgi:hypothetical protein
MSNQKISERYSEIFKRNQNIITIATQTKIHNLQVLVAGCGSTGGAFIEGASRLGVIHFKLAEPDTFDLHNLNRQFVYPSDIGKNKASAHADRLEKLFEGCSPKVSVETNGVTAENISGLLEDVDLVFDAVDVTTMAGMKAKLLLHESAFQKKLPVLSALDLGFKQWIRFYDYRIIKAPLDGRLPRALKCQNPLKALIEGFCDIEELSAEILEEVIKLLTTPGTSACQLASCCHLLAAFSGPILIRFCENKQIPALTTFDLMKDLLNQNETHEINEKKNELVQRLKGILVEIL